MEKAAVTQKTPATSDVFNVVELQSVSLCWRIQRKERLDGLEMIGTWSNHTKGLTWLKGTVAGLFFLPILMRWNNTVVGPKTSQNVGFTQTMMWQF